MHALVQDLRYAARMLRKNPGIALVAAITLGFGIGANTAIFSLVNAILIQPPPYPDPDRLLFLTERSPSGGRSSVAPANFLDWREQSRVFSHLTAVESTSRVLTGGEQPERISVGRVTANFFDLLGMKPAIGRAFLPEEDRPGGARVVVLTHGLWERRFGRDPKAIGQAITLDGEPHTVIGVLPQRFYFFRRFEALMPAALEPGRAARDSYQLLVLGRLKPEVSLEQARAEMEGIARNIERAHPRPGKGWSVSLERLRDMLVRGPDQDLPVLSGAVAFVLLIACANVANLLLAKAAGRRREMAIRASLGAARGRILRQLLTESVLLAALGGVFGLLLAAWATRLLGPMVPPGVIPSGEPLSLEVRVLAYTLALSVLTGIVFGLAPAWRASKVDLQGELKQGGRAPGGGSARLRSALVVSELALSLVLLAGASLMVRSLMLFKQAKPGFEPENLLTMQIELPRHRYASAGRIRLFFAQALERMAALPGVRAAAISSSLPLRGWSFGTPFEIEGRPPAASSERPVAQFLTISRDYFRTLGIPLKKGRAFSERDDQGAAPVAVVNETFARRFLAGEDPIGKRLRIDSTAAGGQRPGPPIAWEIVGVCGSVRGNELARDAAPEIYVPYQQSAWPDIYVMLRTATPGMNLAAAARAAIQSIDKDQPVTSVRTMQQIRQQAMRVPHVLVGVIGSMGALALALALIGIYGVMSYSVTQRTHELGMRSALGAQRGDLLRLVMRQGAKLTLAGLGIGLAGALALTRVLRNMLYGVTPNDPAALAGGVVLLALVAACATYFPARRAARVDPMAALRYE